MAIMVLRTGLPNVWWAGAWYRLSHRMARFLEADSELSSCLEAKTLLWSRSLSQTADRETLSKGHPTTSRV